MIKLERRFVPIFLTPQEEQRLAQEYVNNGTEVWRDKRIVSALLELSYSKCAYCECELSTESKYMEVDHFAYKDKYPNQVAEWENLLPSCKRCNTSKGEHDVVVEPIVNPFNDIPSDHFEFFLYQFRPKTPTGTATEIAVNLNHHERAVTLRFGVGQAVQASVKNAMDKLELYKLNPTSLRRNKLLAAVEGLLAECMPSKPYAATAATVLHSYVLYQNLRSELQNLGIWNQDLDELHNSTFNICLK